MPFADCSLVAEASFWEQAFHPKTTAIVLWSGFGILTFALLIIARTRWGQAKPLSKCIVLSVFAHILLMGFAYTSQLFSDQPALPARETVKLKILSTLDAPPREVNDGQQPEPWEFASETGVAPEPFVAGPRDVDASFEPLRSSPESLPAMSGTIPQDAAPMTEPDRPVAAVPETQELRVTTSGVGAAEVSAPDTRSVQKPQVAVRPQANALQRKTTAAAVQPIKAVLPTEVPSQLTDTNSSIQSLAATNALDTEGEMIASDVDQLNKTVNSDNDDDSGTEALGALPTDSTGEMYVSNVQPIVDQQAPMTPVTPGIQTPNTATVARAQPVPVPQRRLGDGEMLPETYRMRRTQDRLQFAQAHGGNARTEAAVEAALRWLVANQSEDGRWDSSVFGGGVEIAHVLNESRDRAGLEADTGITGLALLALLGAGHTHLEGDYRTTVQHGLEFLLRRQKASGNMAGDARFYAQMYCHGMATLALCEAYGMTGDYRIKPFVERAVRYTVNSQDPTTGGWRYQAGQKGDMSQFGWQVMALRSAESAGLPVTMRTRAGMLRFLRDTASVRRPGLYSYRKGEDVSRTMTAEALTCRTFLELPRDPNTETIAIDFIMAQPPGQRVDLYYWYYGTLAMYQVGGDRWNTWNQTLQERLLALQVNTGEAAGSWEPNTVWGGYGGRVYTTAMAALCLEVYYRYLPIYK